MNKKDFRTLISQQKRQLQQEAIDSMSEDICYRFLKSLEFEKANQLFAYVPFNQEVKIQSILEVAWEENKQVAVPKVLDGAMNFYWIHGWSDLESGFYNILEPTTQELAIPTQASLMIMPGLAFDINMNRLGYGAGYYDKYLKNHEMPDIRVALAYDFQIFDAIPFDTNDVKVNRLISEKRDIQ